MSNFDQLLHDLNASDKRQKDLDVEECILPKIYDDHFMENDHKVIATGLYKDKRRWYSVCTSVISIYGKFLGIRHVDTIFSESTDIDDLYFDLEFMEMKEVQSVTYEPKN